MGYPPTKRQGPGVHFTDRLEPQCDNPRLREGGQCRVQEGLQYLQARVLTEEVEQIGEGVFCNTLNR